MDIALNLAGLIGPVLVLMTITEILNLQIWSKVDPSIVYLNGMLLFVAGLAIVRVHNRWITDWTVLITIIGWLTLGLGVFRAFYPAAKQIKSNRISYLFLIILLMAGLFLTGVGYFGMQK